MSVLSALRERRFLHPNLTLTQLGIADRAPKEISVIQFVEVKLVAVE